MTTDRNRANQPTTDEEMARVRIGGAILHNGPIALRDYDPAWPELFAREQERIAATLGETALMIEHVGSTSVPGLCAKPIIDILLVVPDSSDESTYVPPMEAAGYVLRIREPEWEQHRLFKGPDTDINLHVFSPDSKEIKRMTLMRDWMRAHPDDRDLYASTKRELSARTWKYVQHYADAKTTVVEEIMARATADSDPDRSA